MLVGVGKTTLVCRVCEILRERCGPSTVQGFYTQEVREEVGGRGRGRRIGFDVVTFDGKRGPLARIDRYEGHLQYSELSNRLSQTTPPN